MAGYQVDWAQLRSVDGQVDTCVTQARAALQALSASAYAVFGSGWRGPAASAFQLGWHEWVEGVHDALTALEELAGALGVAGVQYSDTEGAVRSSMVPAGATP